MSPSPPGWSRFMTMLVTRPSTATMTPGPGWSGRPTPASAAIFPAHGPVALTTMSHRQERRLPVPWSTVSTAVIPPFPDLEADHFRKRPDVGTIRPGSGEKVHGQTPGVHGGIRNPHGGFQARVECRFPCQRCGRRHFLYRNPTGPAPLQKKRSEGHVLIVCRHEQAVVLLERFGGNFSEDPFSSMHSTAAVGSLTA